jgi:hypothetical protein
MLLLLRPIESPLKVGEVEKARVGGNYAAKKPRCREQCGLAINGPNFSLEQTNQSGTIFGNSEEDRA